MDFLAFINTYQYSLVPALIAFIVIAVIAIYLGIIFWVARDVTTRTKNILAIAAAIILVAVLNFIGLVFYLLIRPMNTLSDNTDYGYSAGIDNPNLINCVNCKEVIRHEFNNCPYCGVQQNLICPDCGVRHNPTWTYCENCGHNFTKTKNRRFKIIFSAIGKILNLPAMLVKQLKRIPTPKLKFSSRLKFPKFRLPKFRRPKTVFAAVDLSKTDSKSETSQKNKKTPKSESPAEIKIDAKPIKYNKDGTPRKPRSDAGRERGNYKPRQ